MTKKNAKFAFPKSADAPEVPTEQVAETSPEVKVVVERTANEEGSVTEKTVTEKEVVVEQKKAVCRSCVIPVGPKVGSKAHFVGGPVYHGSHTNSIIREYGECEVEVIKQVKDHHPYYIVGGNDKFRVAGWVELSQLTKPQ